MSGRIMGVPFNELTLLVIAVIVIGAIVLFVRSRSKR